MVRPEPPIFGEACPVLKHVAKRKRPSAHRRIEAETAIGDQYKGSRSQYGF